MSTLAEIDLDGLIQALDAIHGLVKRDPDGAQAWLGDLMLSLRTPPEPVNLPGLEMEPEELEPYNPDDPLINHPVIGRPREYEDPPFEPSGTWRPEEPGQHPRRSRPYRMPFGKHHGKSLIEIVKEGDRDYLEWIAKSSQTSRSVKREVQRFLNGLPTLASSRAIG